MNPVEIIRREPYRLLFPLAVAGGVLGAEAGARGAVEAHAGWMLGAYVGLMAAGFLLTAVPRLTGEAPLSARCLGLLAGLALLLLAAPAAGDVRLWRYALLALAAGVAVFAGRRRGTEARPPLHFSRWGAAGVVLAIVGIAGAGHVPSGAAVLLLSQGLVPALVVVAGPIVGPRIHGDACGTFEWTDGARRVDRLLLLLFLASFAVEIWPDGSRATGLLLRGLAVGGAVGLRRLVRWSPFPQRLAFSVSIVAVPAGLLAAAAAPAHLRVACLHVAYVAGFSLMILAVATRVMIAHGGEAARLDRPYGPAWAMLGLALAAAALRFGADAAPSVRPPHLVGAAAAFVAAHALLLLGPGRRLLRRDGGA